MESKTDRRPNSPTAADKPRLLAVFAHPDDETLLRAMTPTTPSPLSDAVQQAKALAHPARARILAMLRGGPLCVSQLTAVLELAVSTVSGHLSALHRSGLITEEKHGKWVQYGLTNDPERNQLLQQVFSLFERDARSTSRRRLFSIAMHADTGGTLEPVR